MTGKTAMVGRKKNICAISVFVHLQGRDSGSVLVTERCFTHTEPLVRRMMDVHVHEVKRSIFSSHGEKSETK